MMTEERAKMIIEAIEAYDDKEALYAMSPEDATVALNVAGNDFTVEEITEAGESLKAVAQVISANGEIDESELERVAGGKLNIYQGLWAGAVTCYEAAFICAVIGCCW